MDILGLTNLLAQIGALGVSALVIWGLLTERIVPKGRLEEERKRAEDCQRQLEVERARHER